MRNWTKRIENDKDSNMTTWEFLAIEESLGHGKNMWVVRPKKSDDFFFNQL